MTSSRVSGLADVRNSESKQSYARYGAGCDICPRRRLKLRFVVSPGQTSAEPCNDKSSFSRELVTPCTDPWRASTHYKHLSVNWQLAISSVWCQHRRSAIRSGLFGQHTGQRHSVRVASPCDGLADVYHDDIQCRCTTTRDDVPQPKGGQRGDRQNAHSKTTHVMSLQ